MVPMCSCGGGCSPDRRLPQKELRQANQRLKEVLGVDLGHSEQWLCPFCLRFLSPICASEAHYPSDSLPWESAKTFMCTKCNNELGARIEGPAQRYLKQLDGTFEARLRRGDGRPGRKVTIDISAEGGNLWLQTVVQRKGRSKSDPDLEGLAQEASGFFVSEVPGLWLDYALLAWAIHQWIDISGYWFALSPGARAAVEIVTGDRDPRGLKWVAGPGSQYAPSELGVPEPVVLVEGDDPSARFVALGSRWGDLICLIPLALDGEAWVYRYFAQRRSLGVNVLPLGDVSNMYAGAGRMEGPLSFEGGAFALVGAPGPVSAEILDRPSVHPWPISQRR